MTPFWWKWSSWTVELIAGALLAAALLGTGGSVPASIVFSVVMSVWYEFLLDSNRGKPNHRPWVDVGQRAVGSAIILVVYALLQR